MTLKVYPFLNQNLKFTLVSEGPLASGLGSSARLCVALAALLLVFLIQKLENEEVTLE